MRHWRGRRPQGAWRARRVLDARGGGAVCLAVCLVLLFAGRAPAVVPGEVRVALLIGNSGYAHVPDLVNPANDAADLGGLFERLGFEVETVENADFDRMRRALDRFRDRSAEADVSVVYFAGHGIEVGRRNWLLPVDAELANLGDVTFQSIPLGMLRAAAEPASRLSLVIVDACRNNPFLAEMQGVDRALHRGLAMVAPQGQNRLVAFAAKEGTVAADGTGRNSPFAEALMAELSTPGVEIGKLFRRVRDHTLALTGGVQEPALYGSLSAADFYFLPPPGQAAAPQSAAAGTAALGTASALELEFWRAVRELDEAEGYADYLAAFPEGLYAPLAARRLARSGQGATGASASSADLPVPEASAELTERVEAPTGSPPTSSSGGADAVAAMAPTSEFAALTAPDSGAGPTSTEAGEAPAASGPAEAPPTPPQRGANGAASAAAPAADMPSASSPPGGANPEQGERALALLSPPAASAPDPEPVALDLTRRETADLQARLDVLGHEPGPVDGLFGARTSAALARFQSAEGLPVTRIFDRPTVVALERAVDAGRLAAHRAEIEAARARTAAAARARADAAARAREAKAEARAAAHSTPAIDPIPPASADPAAQPEPEAAERQAEARPADPPAPSRTARPAYAPESEDDAPAWSPGGGQLRGGK